MVSSVFLSFPQSGNQLRIRVPQFLSKAPLLRMGGQTEEVTEEPDKRPLSGKSSSVHF